MADGGPHDVAVGRCVMPAQPQSYQKHDSFAGMRHRLRLPQDVEARIRRVEPRLDSTPLTADAKAVVRTACRELLGGASPHAGCPPFTLHSYVREEISRLTDEELPRYLFYRFRYETSPRRHLVDDFPPCLQIEPTSVCNYRCVFCYQQDPGFSRRTSGYMGSMALELFTRLIDQAEGRCEAVTLASRGEPLLCPAIDRMLAYVRGKFLALKMNTNASLLHEAHCHAILQAGVNLLVFSVDAADEPAYSRLRVGGDLERVRRNLERFQAIRAKHYPHARTITRISGVKVEGTPDLDRMEAVWGSLADQVAFVTYNPWDQTYELPLHDLTAPCSELWLRMFVWWDGTVNPCENDYKSTLRVGDANEQGLSELWRSAAYQRLREQHLAAKRSQRSPCNRCPVI